MGKKHTMSDLYQMQSLPLSVKVTMTKRRIRDWVDYFGLSSVNVSFSAGKDSTVLLHIARSMYPNIKAIFVDVPTQYPELKKFAMSYDNVDIIKPRISFMEVCEKYGFPFFSKEISECIADSRRYIKILTDRQTDRQTDRGCVCLSDSRYDWRRQTKEQRQRSVSELENGEYP